MGEYHYYPESGYKGQWFDPIADWDYKGPTWMVCNSDMDGRHCIEQMRLRDPVAKKAIPTLRAGSTDWKDYSFSALVRPMVRSSLCGILFRYQTSMMHYGFFLVENRVELQRVEKLERTVLASTDVNWSTDEYNKLEVNVSGDLISCFLDGKLVLSARDTRYDKGCIALCACRPARYRDISVDMDDQEWNDFSLFSQEQEQMRKKEAARHAKPVLYRKIDLGDFGAGRQIRFGHLTGTSEMFFVICQNQRKVYKDRYPVISCMTAVSIDSGKVLWQIGESCDSEETVKLTTDLPFQIYDIDNDGVDEVIASWDFRLMIIDGPTGAIRKSIPTPLNQAQEDTVTGLEFGKYAFSRLNVDAIRIVNVSARKRPEDILIKDRYSRIWIYNSDLEYQWEFSKYNTGHFPYGYDFDGDHHDEIFSCYNLIGSDGKLIWSLPIETDHTDEIIIGKIDPDRDDIIAIVSGWEGFMLVSDNGEILLRDINGHSQRISCANFCPGRKGLEICTTTFWGNNGIIYLHDCKGREIWHREMLCNGNIIAPVNWDGNGNELILLNGDCGMIDGNGRTVVSFPDDGHPCLCAEVQDLTGDARDEIILWDRKTMYIYTQDCPSPEDERGQYKPEKYPTFNGSNYRGEFSFPHWEK